MNKYESIKIIRKFITKEYNNLSNNGKKYISLKYVGRLKKEKLVKLYIEIKKVWYVENFIQCDLKHTNISTILDDFNGYTNSYIPDLTDITKN